MPTPEIEVIIGEIKKDIHFVIASQKALKLTNALTNMVGDLANVYSAGELVCALAVTLARISACAKPDTMPDTDWLKQIVRVVTVHYEEELRRHKKEG